MFDKTVKFLKTNIFGLIIGAVLFGSIGVYAGSTIAGNLVVYDNSNSGATPTTVQAALDDLYNKTTPGTLTLGSTNGTSVDITTGFYNKVDTTAVYNAGLAAGTTTHTGTYTFATNDTGGTKDLGADHAYRYVNATNVYNKGKADGVTTHSGTYTFATNDTGGTKDLGVKHTYRYVNASNVYNKGKADGGISGNKQGGSGTSTMSVACKILAAWGQGPKGSGHNASISVSSGTRIYYTVGENDESAIAVYQNVAKGASVTVNHPSHGGRWVCIY